MPVNFQTDGYAIIHLPREHDRLVGQTFTAEIHGCLAFLQCEFLLPPEPAPDDPALPSTAMAFTLFTPREPDFTLWHEHLAHAGIESTREVLTGTYGQGVNWNGKTRHTKCIYCILGKVPRAPYDHNALQAAEVLALVHMDICGPFPVQGPSQKRYFIIALDDCSSYAAVDCIATRDQASVFFIAVQRNWERQTGKKLHIVCLDGAQELVSGELGQHFVEQGISVQQTARYAHQQNGVCAYH